MFSRWVLVESLNSSPSILFFNVNEDPTTNKHKLSGFLSLKDEQLQSVSFLLVEKPKVVRCSFGKKLCDGENSG